MKSQAKTAGRRLLAMCGNGLVKFAPRERYQPTPFDEDTVRSLLAAIMPAAEQNALSGDYPMPRHLKLYFTPSRASMMRLLLDQCDDAGVTLAGQRILDLGCHGGLLLRLLSQRYSRTKLYGADTSDARLSVARLGCPEADMFVSKVENLPRGLGMDVIFFTEVLEHLVDPDEAVRLLLDATSAHGTVVLTVPDGREDRTPAKRFRPHQSWNSYLEQLFPRADVRTAKLATGHLFAAVRRPVVSRGWKKLVEAA